MGKGTLLKRLFARVENLVFSISATTRPPRPGEVDGVSYHFYTREQFEEGIERRASSSSMPPTTAISTERLPTSIAQQREQGLDVILEIEVQGAMRVHELAPDAILVYIKPPSREELERRLRARRTESEERILSRLTTALYEESFLARYDYVLVNSNLEVASEILCAIIEAERKQPQMSSLPLADKRVLLGVSGSIAAYKAADLCSRLGKLGASVHVVLTAHAERFIGVPTLRALTRNPVLTDLFEEPQTERIAHIDLAQSADLILVAPASANLLAKMAHGLADDHALDLPARRPAHHAAAGRARHECRDVGPSGDARESGDACRRAACRWCSRATACWPARMWATANWPMWTRSCRRWWTG